MRILPLAHLHLSPCLREGGRVVDATAGNGHDTLFLARAVGSSGCVHAFDINAEALHNTSARLEAAGLSACLHPHLSSHAHMADWVEAGQDAIIFNLGYLPGAKHERITQTEESLRALRSALSLLRLGGRLCLMCYPGHEGGRAEYNAISAFLRALSLSNYTVLESTCHNGSAAAPVLFSVEKQAED